jgi:N-acylneuraminate cytidylyltransferase
MIGLGVATTSLVGQYIGRNMKNIAIIPARGGSKRIPRKNIREFHGKPIIAYPIHTALASGLFDVVMVSTDDEEIASVSKKHGALIPFFRSRENSDDHAPLANVIMEVLNDLEKRGNHFDNFCCILPATPFILPEHLKKGYNLLTGEKFDSVFPAVRFSHPIQRAFRIKHGKATMLWPEMMEVRTQDLPTSYHDSGQFYWVNIMSFFREKRLFMSNTGAIEFTEYDFIDIDDETDWERAELLFSIKQQMGQ